VRSKLEIQILQDLQALAPVAMGYLSGPDACWNYVNNLLVRAAGRTSAEDLLGLTVRDSMPELECTGVLELLDNIYRTAFLIQAKSTKSGCIERKRGGWRTITLILLLNPF
jgi:hypothetical protein